MRVHNPGKRRQLRNPATNDQAIRTRNPIGFRRHRPSHNDPPTPAPCGPLPGATVQIMERPQAHRNEPASDRIVTRAGWRTIGDAARSDEVEHVATKPLLIGGRVSGLEHPTDAAAQMLDEGSEPSPIDAADGKVSIEQDLSCLMRSVLQMCSRKHATRRGRLQ